MNHSIVIHKTTPPGSTPGEVLIPEEALEPRLNFISYNKDMVFESSVEGSADLIRLYEENQGSVCWIEVKGFKDKTVLEDLAEYFNLHKLELEDIINVYQRPKLEEYPGHIFMTARILGVGKTVFESYNHQLSLILKKNLLISFQHDHEEHFEQIKERIRKGKGYIRGNGSDFLVYVISDLLVDHFFPLIEQTAEFLDDLELQLLVKPKKESLRNLIRTKRNLINYRKIVWAERDKINDILRTDTEFITDSSKLYFKDVYDHCFQLLEMLDSYKEITSSTMDIYLSSVSNRLNQIMKVLTIVSSIFIPLTFIVGIYGMNFSHTDPETGKVLPWNMPELYTPYGYIIVLGIMAAVVLLQLYYFYKKGWLRER